MKPLLITGLLVLALLGLTACSSGSGTDQPQPEQTGQMAEAAGNMDREETASQAQTEYISAVPEEYFAPSDHPGQVVEITYDSRDYTDPAEPAIQKTAHVYLPYDYDETDADTRYNILYLMHGWTMTAGDFFDPAQSDIVPMLDHMIENGDVPPVIVVCATFDAQNQSQGFSRSVEELSVFHRDLRENLIPFVESRYHTYAQDVTEEGLQASREHRAFGGFSLGAVTTWYQFIYNLDYIKYFVPMSGDCWIMGTYSGLYQPVETVDYLEQVVSDGGWDGDDFCIYQGIGTNDPIWDQTDSQITVLEGCIGCGVCQSVCPVGNFYLEGGKARRKQTTCEFCLACAQNCPQKAIGLSIADKNPKARYRNPHISLQEIIDANRNS